VLSAERLRGRDIADALLDEAFPAGAQARRASGCSFICAR
jgi:hypothetical protein